MKVTLYMAMSVNGMIARKNGEEDFLSHENWQKFESLARDHGNFVVGRKTYEAVKDWDEEYSFDTVTDVEKVIMSQNPPKAFDESYTTANSPRDAVEKLSRKGFEKILVIGGATINSAFAKSKLLDEIILNVEPVLIGRGIALFSEENFDTNVELISSEERNGLLTLQYRVVK